MLGSATVALLVSGFSFPFGPVAQSTPVQEETEESTSTADLPFSSAPGQPVPASGEAEEDSVQAPADGDVRIATLNAELVAESSGNVALEQLISALATGNHAGARSVAQMVQINAPDVLVLTGVSHDSSEQIADQLKDSYLASGQHGESGVEYPYVFTSNTNSGVESGADLDRDGTIGGAGDAIGFGEYPGQYGVVVFSKYPILNDEVRTFQDFLWKDLPDNSMDEDAYSSLEASILRLHQTSLWDVPLDVEGQQLHVIAHSIDPFPDDSESDPARSEDERRVLADYVSGRSWYLYDDDGELGGLEQGADFVIAGQSAAGYPMSSDDQDLDPLLEDAALQDPEPQAYSEVPLQERSQAPSQADPSATRELASGDYVRSSFVLPAAELEVSASGVFWPADGEHGYDLVNLERHSALKDRLVWADLTMDR